MSKRQLQVIIVAQTKKRILQLEVTETTGYEAKRLIVGDTMVSLDTENVRPVIEIKD